MDGDSRGRAVHFRRLDTILPCLVALACGVVALMESALAARYSAPFAVSVSSGLMLSALLLAHDGNRWRVPPIGLVSVFVGFAGGGAALPVAASGAAVEVVTALAIRSILGRTGQLDLDFASLVSFGRFFLIVALVNLGLEAPLRLLLMRATDGDFSYDYFIQQFFADALGALIIAPSLAPAIMKLRNNDYGPLTKWVKYLGVIALSSLFIFVMFKSTLTPLLPTLTIITFIGLRLGVPAAALCIMIAVAIGSEYFAFRYDPGEGSVLDPLSRNLKIQQFAAICLVIVMPVAATLAEKARLSAQLAESQHELEAVLQSTGHVAFRTDPSGRFTYLSRAWEQLMGIPIASALGRSVFDFSADPNKSSARHALAGADALNSGREVRSIVRSDGQVLDVEVTYHTLRGQDGSFAGVDGAMRDITKLKKLRKSWSARAPN
ncbi:MAG: PAS domain S-box protein [Novosphingobium sp.]|nr:PAS domain S-box protein [Novosphingobium sp.]